MTFLLQELPAEERNKFEKLCNDDKARHKQEMFTYIPPLAPDEEVALIIE